MAGQTNPDVQSLIDMSRATGADTSLVVWGGGNSSVKSETVNHRGRKVRALYVKGSGSDMKALEPKHLAALDLDALLELTSRHEMSDEDMVEYLNRSQIQNGPRGSIETLLHAFLPAKFVLHTHADASAALSDHARSRQRILKCWKGTVAAVPYQRPGFGLSLATYQVYKKHGGRLQGIMLEKHGLITWGETGEEALRHTRQLIAQAAQFTRVKAWRPKARKANLLPALSLAALRGALSVGERQVLMFDGSPAARDFASRLDAARLGSLGPATPDHLIYSKPGALHLDLGKDASSPKALKIIRAGVAKYRAAYDAYFKKYAAKGLVKIDASPRVVLIKNHGVVTASKDPRSCEIGRDIWRHSMAVRVAAKKQGGYQPIGLDHICDFEYWPLENYKLTLASPEKEFSRKIAVVTGAARGIGRACALALAKAGACVAVLDLDIKAAQAVALEAEHLGGPGKGLALACDISSEKAVKAAFAATVQLWGGLDLLVSNAGLAKCAPVKDTQLKDWEASFGVNARGHFLCAREAANILDAQGLGGDMVFVSSKNVLAPGKDFAAYSASKAAQTQLGKVLALELAGLGVRVNSVAPDGVFEDSRLWDGIRASRAKAHGIKPDRLKDFYVERNLLKREVRPQDVAEAVLFLASPRASRTTGAILSVDGGIKEAFVR